MNSRSLPDCSLTFELVSVKREEKGHLYKSKNVLIHSGFANKVTRLLSFSLFPKFFPFLFLYFGGRLIKKIASY